MVCGVRVTGLRLQATGNILNVLLNKISCVENNIDKTYPLLLTMSDLSVLPFHEKDKKLDSKPIVTT